MRFTSVSLALLALANSVAPGVHGAPAVALRANDVCQRASPNDDGTGCVVGSRKVRQVSQVTSSVLADLQDIENILKDTICGLLPTAAICSFLNSTSSTATSHALRDVAAPQPVQSVLSKLGSGSNTPTPAASQPSSHPSAIASPALQAVHSPPALALSNLASGTNTPPPAASQT